ncbi:hypothetical protein V1477_009657 [Vespula maculifrons]|uniref:Uncharacterized protein n=1 Tax=Vespula maculifrons TaxID=7453 RepID=A0ABD2CAD0_VESMC
MDLFADVPSLLDYLSKKVHHSVHRRLHLSNVETIELLTTQWTSIKLIGLNRKFTFVSDSLQLKINYFVAKLCRVIFLSDCKRVPRLAVLQS